jgi:hypothetical protein
MDTGFRRGSTSTEPNPFRLEPSNLGFLLLKALVLVGVLVALFHLRGMILAEESLRALRQSLIGRWETAEKQLVLEFCSDKRATLHWQGALVFDGSWAWEGVEELWLEGRWQWEGVEQLRLEGRWKGDGRQLFQARIARDGLTLTNAGRSGPRVFVAGKLVPLQRETLTFTRQE